MGVDMVQTMMSPIYPFEQGAPGLVLWQPNRRVVIAPFGQPHAEQNIGKCMVTRVVQDSRHMKPNLVALSLESWPSLIYGVYFTFEPFGHQSQREPLRYASLSTYPTLHSLQTTFFPLTLSFFRSSNLERCQHWCITTTTKERTHC